MNFNENLFDLGWIFILISILMIFSGNYDWIILLIIFGSTILLLLSREDKVPEITIKRIVKGKNYKEGDSVNIKLVVKNSSNSIFQGEIVDKTPDYSSIYEGSNIFLLTLDPLETITLEYKLLVPRRGKYLIGPISLRHHNLGLTREIQWEIDSLKEIIVIPNPQKVSTYTLPPELLTLFGGVFKSKLVGDGLDFSGIREYVPGDSLRRINWKVSAKFGELYSNEFELKRSTNVMIILDLTEESMEIADETVRAALGLAQYLINSRTMVGVMTLGKFIKYIPSKGGKRHLIEISQHLTTVDNINQIPDLQLFRRRLDQTVQRAIGIKYEILLFSSLSRPENVRILAESLSKLGKITVLAPSGVHIPFQRDQFMRFAENLINLRKRVIRQNLATKNIRVFEWVPELPFESSIQTWRNKS